MQQCIQNFQQFRFPILLGETNCLQFLPTSRIEPIQLYQLGRLQKLCRYEILAAAVPFL